MKNKTILIKKIMNFATNKTPEVFMIIKTPDGKLTCIGSGDYCFECDTLPDEVLRQKRPIVRIKVSEEIRDAILRL